MTASKKLLAKRARWMEPIGQILVLLGVGLQVFYLDPVKSDIAYNYIDGIESALDDVGFKVTRIMNQGSKPLTDEEKSRYNSALIDRGTKVYNNSREYRDKKIYLGKWFATLFFVGSILVVIGKSASIKASS